MIHKVTIGIEAPTGEQATDIAQDLVDIKNSLSDKDLKDLKLLLKKNPGIVQIAKQYLGKK